MARLCWLMMAAGMLCCLPACALDRYQRLEKRDILLPLKRLQSTPPYTCLKDRRRFQFPWTRGNITQVQRSAGTCCHQLMLQHVFSLFSSQASRDAWNRTRLDTLLSGLHRSLQRLEQTDEESLVCPSLGLAVEKYFQRIRHYLKEKRYSSCAWEIVRGEIQARFSLMRVSRRRMSQ